MEGKSSKKDVICQKRKPNLFIFLNVTTVRISRSENKEEKLGRK